MRNFVITQLIIQSFLHNRRTGNMHVKILWDFFNSLKKKKWIAYALKAAVQGRCCTRPPGGSAIHERENFNLALPVFGPRRSYAQHRDYRDFSPGILLCAKIGMPHGQSRRRCDREFVTAGAPALTSPAAIMYPVVSHDPRRVRLPARTGVHFFPPSIAFVRILLPRSRTIPPRYYIRRRRRYRAATTQPAENQRKSTVRPTGHAASHRWRTNSTETDGEIVKLYAQHSTPRPRPSFYFVPVVRCCILGTRFVG